MAEQEEKLPETSSNNNDGTSNEKELGAENVPKMSEEDFINLIGLVEDIFISEDFQTKHADFFLNHCKHFSGEAPSSASGTAELEALSKEQFSIFRMYSVEMASYLETELKRSLGENFVIDKFIHEMEARAKQAESAIAQERASSAESNPNSPRRVPEGPGGIDINLTSDLMGIDLEIVEILLTLKDYGRFQELMEDYAKMVQGKTPELEDLVQLRRISSDEALSGD